MADDEILGIGGPILDQLLQVSEEYLSQSVPGEKGGMEPVSEEQMHAIISGSGKDPVTVLGGSARNTMQGLARFGERCSFHGMVGNDDRAALYRSLLGDVGVHPHLIEVDAPTATVLSLVTPDGQRTMRTLQGASVQFRGQHLDPAIFRGKKLVHLEGYTLFNEDLPREAMRLAKAAGAKVSFDLASFEIVRAYKETIHELLEDYVDIIFCNELESRELTGKDEEGTCDFLASKCEIGVVLMGTRGSWVRSGAEKHHCPAYPVDPVDTTGAGDLYASGFLHGFLQNYSLNVCGHYGAIAGRAVVQFMGPQIPHDAWPAIFAELQRREHDIT